MRMSGKSSKETVNETMRTSLLKPQRRPAKRFKVRPKKLGLKPGYSYDKPWEIIEQIEGANYK